MEQTDSITPSDRQSGPKHNKKSGQQEADTTMANDVDPSAPAAAPPDSVERTSKSGSCSRKSRQQKKEKSQETKPASAKGEAETSSISSEDESASDDNQVSKTTTLAPKHYSGVNGTSKNKKERANGDSSKKKTSKASIKKQKKPKKKKNKTGNCSDTASDSDSDADSSDPESSDNEDPAEKNDRTKSSSGFEGQLRALELRYAQLQHQLGNSHGLAPSPNLSAFAQPPNPTPSAFASFGSSAPQYSLQNALASHAADLDPLFAGRRSIPVYHNPNRRRRPMRLSTVPTLEGSDRDSITNDHLRGESRVKGKKPKGPAFMRVDQVWDNSIHNFKLQDTADTDTDSQYDEYIFHVRRKFDWEGKHVATVVDIKSKLLRECLQDVIGNADGISLVDETPKINPEVLFLYLEALRDHLKALRKAKPAGKSKKSQKKNKNLLKEKKQHLKILIKYLDHDFESTKESLYPMLKNGLITFELLWALWKPDTLVYATTYGNPSEPRVFKVESAHLHHSVMRGSYYHVEGKYMEFDGKRFGYGNTSVEIDGFQGAKKIKSLPCYPLQYHHNEQKLRLDLIERGKKFASLSGVHYKSYKGIAFMKRRNGSVMKFNIQSSRAMIDPTIFRRTNPNYSVSTVKPKDPDIIEDETSESDCGNCACGSDSEGAEAVKFVKKVYKDENGDVHMVSFPKSLVQDEPGNAELDELPSKNVEGDNDEDMDIVDFTDEDYLIASPVVLGFSFSEKQWLEFAVSCVNEIKWNEKAWDSLVLEDGTKDLIKALVKSRKYHAANTIDDVIQGKGKGLVTVLHGPPGTGKTLTAEGIGELLQCPLYMVSAGELGTDSRFLEAELQKILDICHAWGAILLLDEADVFLEKRNMHDIHRNALVSIFLRQLEYFQGILFLTTNRVETFDEAFQSRIHIALRYDNLKSPAKRAIFKMFLDRVHKLGKLKVEPLTEDDLDLLSKQALNGREIKNVVGSAQDLAVNKGEALSMRHIKQVLDVHAKFGRDLKGGPGYEDAMRSYF
ncbi:TOB3 (member of AAA-ATPase family) [Fusarium subglutinans]|uniref:TOB3 (Member of AAA-ATPase family) n=1 Tax=Gibberella subglutinans TaxID=42677 RepID=A0A8H5V9G3_GIBSU|nr:TOB3 (member of AAA-ATPase family) [Fusarium subglutinans]KAF5613114.1 TOB3 (member of AAA-ATPase family) [Fusarium subglutinans]